MKTKFLLFSAILFFILGRHFHDELVFYFFSLQMLMLFSAVMIHKLEQKRRARRDAGSLSGTDLSKQGTGPEAASTSN